MELTAYVSGDAAVVTQLLSQVAIIMKGGTFETGVKLFALVGILMGLFGGLMKGGKLSAEIFVLPIFIIAIGIIPKVDLVIEDASGGLSKIDDLPVIAAAPISLVTNIGNGLTTMLTDNLGLDDKSISMANGHIVKVRAPLAIQEVMLDPEINDEFAALPGGIDITTDIPRYVFKCVSYDMRHSGDAPASLFNGNVNTAFAVGQKAFTVATSTGGSLECNEYFENIMTGIESAEFEAGLKTVLNREFARYKNDTEIGDRYIEALDELVASRSDFYKSILFGHAIKKARADFTRAGGGGSSYMALEDAMNQRRWSNFGAASMVFETLQHMTTFVEGWTLGILPLVALLFVAGPAGIKLGIKYFWLLVWTQLWQPTILITIGILDAYAQGAATSTYSIAQVSSFLEEMQRLEDVGYLFLSLTTMMSIFLIYGSSTYLAGSLQSDMTATQHYDPKKNAPDTLQRDPYVHFEKSFGYTDAGGYVGNVKSLANVQFTMDTQRSEGVSSQDLKAFAATGERSASSIASVGAQTHDELVASNSKASLDSQATSLTERKNENLGSSFEAGNGLTASATENHVTGQSGEVNATGSLSAVAGRVAGAITGRGGDGESAGRASGAGTGLPIDAGISGRLTHQDSVATQAGANRSMRGEQELRTSTETGAALTEEARVTEEARTQQSESSSTTSQTQEMTAESQRVSETDSQSHSVTEQMSVGRGGRQTIGGIEAANAIAGDRSLMSKLTRDVSEAGISSTVENYLDRNASLLDKTFMGPDAEDSKYAFASMMVMQNMGGPTPFIGDPDAADRMAALNALGDEYLYTISYGGTGSQYGDQRDNDAIAEGEEDIAARGGYVRTQVAISEGSVETALAEIDPDMAPRDRFEEMMRVTAPRLDALTQGQASGVFSELRQDITSRYSEEMEAAKPLVQQLRENGIRGYLRGLVGSAEDVNKAHTADVFEGTVGRTGDGILGYTDIDGVTAEQLLETRQKDFAGVGVHEDDPIGRYMALTQLETGARTLAGGLSTSINGAFGGDQGDRLTELADEFEGMRQDMIAEHPELSNEAKDQEISGLAIIAAGSNTAFERTYPAAQMLGSLAAEEQRYEDMTGLDVSSDGSLTEWDTRIQPGNYGNDRESIVQGIHDTADALGIEPWIMGTVMSYETAGTFDPTIEGKTPTKHGIHRGFLQFGEPQAREHGVDWNDPVNSQLGPDGAVVSYLRDAGVQPGMGLLEVYSAINAGGIGEEYYNRSDAHVGGMPGTVRDKVNSEEMQQHAARARQYMSL